MAENRVDKTCNEFRWMTPERELAAVRRYFGGQIPLDPATEPNNPTRAHRFFTIEDDGLNKPWLWPVFCNPPYGKVIRQWCRKFYIESTRASTGLEIIALLPVGSGRPGTIYWQDYILQPSLKAICYVKGRVPFLNVEGAAVNNNTYPSSFWGFNVDVDRFVECFRHLGKTLRVDVADPAQQEPEWLPARGRSRRGRSAQGRRASA